MSTTSIEWATDTLNPGIYGCSKVSPACTNCYAMPMAERLERMGQDLYAGTAKDGQWTGVVRTIPLEQARARIELYPRKRGPGRKRVFVTSMSDVLHEKVDLEWAGGIIEAMGNRPDIDWLVLTKRAYRLPLLAEWVEGEGYAPAWPSNVWIGVTVENCKQLTERGRYLLDVPAAVRFLSVEPLLEDIAEDLQVLFCTPGPRYPSCEIDWVICGGESGRKARPMHPDWARSVRDQCQADGVPFFFKQWGRWEIASDENGHGGSMPGPKGDMVWVGMDGRTATPSWRPLGDASEAYAMAPVGKHKAGRELDGRTWDQFPTVTP